MNARERDQKGRYLPKVNAKKIHMRVTEQERNILHSVRSIKVTLMGLENTGKTVLFHRYIRHKFIPDYNPTIGMNAEGIKVGDIGVSIWDLGGQLQFRRVLWELYTRNSKGIIFLVDMNAPADFPKVREVLAKVLSYRHLQHIPFAIFLNKIDLISQQRSKLLENLNLNTILKDRIYKPFFTSAKTGYNVKSGFKWIISKIILQSGLEIPKKFTPRVVTARRGIPSIPKTPYITQIRGTTNNKIVKKIIFMSLAMAGQATICKRIMNPDWIPSKDDQYYATIDYKRYQKEILGTEFTLFNLGGQTAFLDRFTGELAEFIFRGVVAYIFTIDSINIKEITRAKYYFDLSLKKIDQYSPKSSVFLFIHKQDLLPKSMKDEVNQTIEEYMLKDVNRAIGVFHTTVFNNSILLAMDAVFREHIQIYEKDLLFVDTSNEDNHEDDNLLSLSLREALKILRD